jgi:toxin-antitoxin system, toxin component, bro family (fragment)
VSEDADLPPLAATGFNKPNHPKKGDLKARRKMKHRTPYRLTEIPEVAYIIHTTLVSGHPHPTDIADFLYPNHGQAQFKGGLIGGNTTPSGNTASRLTTVVEARHPYAVAKTKLNSQEGIMPAQSQIAPATFTFQDITIAAIERDGLLWLEANQVCRALEYGNPRQALSSHVEEDDVQKLDTIDALGRTQQSNFINESGLYALIFGSKKESAKTFKRWVTSEVLPTIRKTGSYESKARPSKTRKALPGGLTLEQQDSIKALHRELVKAAPKDLQGKLAIRLWSAIKSKYGVTYKEVPPTEYAEILSLMARTAQEMPLLVEEKPAHIAVMDFDTRRDGEWRVYIRDGKAYRLAAMYATVQGDPYAPR